MGLTLFILTSSAVLVHCLIRLLVFLISSVAISTNLPIARVKLSILTAKSLGFILLAGFVFSFDFNEAVSLLIVLILGCGAELAGHLKKRTTAAYSTSDGMNQRMFNLTLILLAVFTLIMYGLHLGKWDLFPAAVPEFFEHLSHHRMGQLLYAAAFVFFLRYLWLTGTHFRTLSYLFYSYLSSFRQGKLKRFW